MKSSPIKLKQKLSPSAAKRKADADLKMAKSPYRRAAKADAQKRKRANPIKSKGMDYDHKDGKYKSPAQNRGNDGKGTSGKNGEGKSNYKIN
tara:strand:- start:30 stop:305 length:276 start_codon:yes stop_codon:yes gene_type:complete